MSDVNKEVKQEETNSLAPIPEKDRIMGWGSNTMLWLGGCISIGTLAMGSAQMEAGLNLLQLFLAVAIGSMILVVGIAMNDQFSYKTGAPYAVQLRSAFGTKGNKIPSLIRDFRLSYGTVIRHGLEEQQSTIFQKHYLDMIISGYSSFYSRLSRSCYQSKDSKVQNGLEISEELLFLWL